VSHSKRHQHDSEPDQPLELLTSLGFGPDTVLMNDPKLFVDGRFLASLLVELYDELPDRQASLALFQIGLLHGLRDAARVCSGHEVPERPGHDGAETTSLVMQWKGPSRGAADEPFLVRGSWPERHEAMARCARLGAASEPTCWMSAGYTTGWLSSVLERPLLAREVECAARGDEHCRFEMREISAWPDVADETIDWLLREVPFEAFRSVAAERYGAPPPSFPPTFGPDFPPEGGFDRDQPVVHIWGPVMVLPFTTLDEALGTVDMLSRDPGIHEIRAVVVDLRERDLDEGFGTAALEQVLETIESWNAQSLLTGIGPGAERAVASLETSHLILRKDLSEAIATAFQVADAQKHLF
jgi:hypothetical protein